MTRPLLSFQTAAAIIAIALPAGLCACAAEVECKCELVTGSSSYTGVAAGKTEDEALRRGALRDACAKKCAAERAAMVTPCTAACVTDVSSGKLGARTTCGRR